MICLSELEQKRTKFTEGYLPSDLDFALSAPEIEIEDENGKVSVIEHEALLMLLHRNPAITLEAILEAKRMAERCQQENGDAQRAREYDSEAARGLEMLSCSKTIQ